MKHIYHFTSKGNWKKIQTLRKLIPETIIEGIYRPKDFKEQTKSICSSSNYIVGFPKPHDKGWVESGLWD